MSTHKKFLCSLLALLLVFLSSCSSADQNADDMLEKIITECSGLPDGSIYKYGVEEGKEGFFSPELCTSLYGDKAMDTYFPLLEDYAFYISAFPAPCEIAVLKCRSASDRHIFEKMLLTRIDELRILLAESEYLEIIDSAELRSSGKFVIMIMVK